MLRSANFSVFWRMASEDNSDSGIDGTVFEEHKSRGFRQIRKGIPLPVMIACACDPRTKNLVGIPPLDQAMIWNQLQRMMEDSYDSINKRLDPTPTSIDSSHSGEASDMHDSFDNFAEIRNPANQLPVVDLEEEYLSYREQIISTELKLYKRMPLLQHTTKVPGDSLNWWRTRTQQFPNLSCVAK
jgi:hypothetical protein